MNESPDTLKGASYEELLAELKLRQAEQPPLFQAPMGEKGQIVIPKGIRDAQGLTHPCDVVVLGIRKK